MELVLWGLGIWVGYKLFRWWRTISRNNAYYEGYVANLSHPEAKHQLHEAIALLRHASFVPGSVPKQTFDETFEKAVWLSDRMKQLEGAVHGPGYRSGLRLGLARELTGGRGNEPMNAPSQEAIASAPANTDGQEHQWPRVTGVMPNLKRAKLIKWIGVTSGSRALLVANAPAYMPRPGQAGYHFVLALLVGKTPVYYVTAERLKDGRLSMWTFDSRAVHEHYDSREDWSDVNRFEAVAVAVAKEAFVREIMRAPRAVQDEFLAALTDGDRAILEQDIAALAHKLQARKLKELAH